MIASRAVAILDRIVADTKAILGDGLVGSTSTARCPWP